MEFSDRFNNSLPAPIKQRLWGNRAKYGLVPDEKDKDWIWWQDNYAHFNNELQNQGIGQVINGQGYKIAREIDLKGCHVLEYGAGNMFHAKYWSNNPEFYTVVDVHRAMASFASSVLEKKKVRHDLKIRKRGEEYSLERGCIDVIFSFYTLEHIHELKAHIEEIETLLKPNGIFVGAIPLEGNLAWGLGRYLTTRRWFKTETDIDPDKIICWEHPNFASTIIGELDEKFDCMQIKYWPFGNSVFFRNFNLVCSFIYRKKS